MAKFAAVVIFDQDAPRLEVRPKHREYLTSLLEAGKLHESGPWGDDTGALIIYEAADQAEAESLFAADPYANTPGVVGEVTIREWNRIFAAGE